MKAIATQGLTSKNLMPYMGVQFEQIVTHEVAGKPRKFHVFTYQAYNALGLIGPEFNGIAIADHDKRQILCDNLARENTGYFGVSQKQVNEFERIVGLPWAQFRDFVNGQPSCRMKLEDLPRKPVRFKMPALSDCQFMTAKTKAKVLREWVTFVRNGFRAEDFKKDLYHHLVQHCSFVAHFDRMGFYGTYFSTQGSTLKFIDQFDRSRGCYSVEYNDRQWLDMADYADINNAMVNLIAGDMPAIYESLTK